MEATWQLPVIGRELAYEFSDILRREKVLSYLISKLNLDGGTPDIQRECARLLEQILTTDNRFAMLVFGSHSEINTLLPRKNNRFETIQALRHKTCFRRHLEIHKTEGRSRNNKNKHRDIGVAVQGM